MTSASNSPSNQSAKNSSPEFKLFPLPYFTIGQAAEQIGVSEEYIRSAIKCGLVRPCVNLDESAPQHSYSNICGDDEVLANIEVYDPSSQLSHGKEFEESPFARPLSSNIDHLLSTPTSQLNITHYQDLGSGTGVIEGYLFGFWQVSIVEVAVQLMRSKEDLSVEVVPYVDNSWYQEQPFEGGMIRADGFSVFVKAEDMVLSYSDTKDLMEAYLTGTPLKKSSFYGLPAKPRMKKKPETKPSEKMAVIIAALIATNPKLGKELITSKVNLAEVLEQHFAREGISLGNYLPHESTVRRWFQKLDLQELVLSVKK